MTKILMVVGSTRTGSFNAQLATAIAAKLDSVDVSFLEWTDVPLMNQDVEFPPPPEVERVRAEVAAADGIWFVTPEYNWQIPGGLKNLTDWLSRSLEQGNPRGESAIGGKVTTVSAVSADGGSHVRPLLEDLLEFIRTDVVREGATGAPINPEAWMSGELTISPETDAALDTQVANFLARVSA